VHFSAAQIPPSSLLLGISQGLACNLLGVGVRFKGQWMSGVLVASLFDLGAPAMCCIETQWKGEGMSAL